MRKVFSLYEMCSDNTGDFVGNFFFSNEQCFEDSLAVTVMGCL